MPTFVSFEDDTMVPVVEFPPVTPFTCQVTAVFVVVVELARVTVAVKSACVLIPTVIAVGEMAIEVMLVPFPPPQPEASSMSRSDARESHMCRPFRIKDHPAAYRDFQNRPTSPSFPFLRMTFHAPRGQPF